MALKEVVKVVSAGAIVLSMGACKETKHPLQTEDITPIATALLCGGMSMGEAIDALEGTAYFHGGFEADRNNVDARCISDEWHIRAEGDGTFDDFPPGTTAEPVKYSSAEGIVTNYRNRPYVRQFSTGPQYTSTPFEDKE